MKQGRWTETGANDSGGVEANAAFAGDDAPAAPLLKGLDVSVCYWHT